MKNEEGRMRKTACGRSVELVQGVYTNEEWSNFGALRFRLQIVSLLEMRPLESVVELPPPVMAPPPPPPELVVEVPPELPMLVLEFCLTAAFEIAIRSNQTPTQYYSITFHLVCLVMVFAFAFIFVAKYVSSKHPNLGRLLDHAGVVCGVTAFFVAITVSFPLCLKLISWIIINEDDEVGGVVIHRIESRNSHLQNV
ncbi:hypothetical protein HYC85_030202 [Camellia sinensis]|uniref:Uncharacterized protein n=1 Tax=Camellia sinensis TaxID=4442 RepID=A0A7J7G1H8_CAMSI|nr:hypothetical protein HYC85_030202 [Camellia sinensis]